MKIFPNLIFLTLFYISCKKDNQPGPLTNKQVAVFYVESKCASPYSNKVQFVDSTVLFINASHIKDSSASSNQYIPTYHWEFGDQQTSILSSPSHVYKYPGTYLVKLYTYLDDQLSDSTFISIQVIMGQREFKIGANNYAIDMDETQRAGMMVLASAETTPGVRAYSILKIDSLLRLKSTNVIAGDNNTVRLSSIKKINDGAYILSGNYLGGNKDEFCISKIDSSGNLIWMKYIDNMPGKNIATIPLSGGGFLTAGNSSKAGVSFDAIVKTDADGNEIWRRTFDSTYQSGVNNIIETDSGYVFASYNLDYAQTVILTRLDFNGNLSKQTTVDPVNGSGGYQAGVIENKDFFFVYTTNATHLFYFNKDLTFSHTGVYDGDKVFGGFVNVGAFGVFSSDFQYSFLTQLKVDGTRFWEYRVEPYNFGDCNGFSEGENRECIRVIYTSTNELALLINGVNNMGRFSIYLQRLTPFAILE